MSITDASPRPTRPARHDPARWRWLRAVRRPRRVRTPTRLQMEAAECGAAALGIVLAHYGRWVPLEELRVACGVSRDGSRANTIVKAARQYGLVANGYRLEPADLPELRLPLIVFWQFNHFVVVEGFGPHKVYLNDPACGPRVVTAAEFDESFTGVALVCEPGPDFTRGGARPSLIAALWRRLAGSLAAVAYLIVAGLGLAFLGLLTPALTRVFVDHILIGGQGGVELLLAAMALGACLRALLMALQQRCLLQLEARLAISMSSRFVWHVLRLPIEFFTQRHPGDIGARVGVNSRLARLIAGDLATTGLNVLVIACYAGLMFQYDTLLTVLGIAVALANLLALRFVARRRADLSQRLLLDRASLLTATVGSVQNIETIKATGREGELFARWAGFHARVVNSQQRAGLVVQAMVVLPTLLAGLSSAAILTLGGLRVMEGALTLGMLAAFGLLMASFLAPVTWLVGLAGTLQDAEGDLSRLDDVLSYPVASQPAGPGTLDGGEGVTWLEGYLELKNVTFGYSRSDPPLIEGVSLSLKPGDRVALVGRSGSGKSTIAKLVSGLYEPWSGQILFDGRPRTGIARPVLTSSIALVDQEITLFEGTIRDNLTLWDGSIPETSLATAARDAGIFAEIEAWPGRFEHVVEEGGRNLSGGQRQRLEIARTLAGDPAVLVLDEATSALDPYTEWTIDEALRRRGCTCLIVAHRLSTVRDLRRDHRARTRQGRPAWHPRRDDPGAGPVRRSHPLRRAGDGRPQPSTSAAMTKGPVQTVQRPDTCIRASARRGDNPDWDHLDRVPGRALAGLDVDDEHPRRGARGRPEEHAWTDRARLQAAVGRLVQAATPDSPRPWASLDRHDPLFAACRLVGEALGHPLQPGSPPHPGSGDTPIQAIARASRLHTRRVTLREAWWTRGSGPCVAYRTEDNRPVAILPRLGGYELHDPVAGTVTPVTATVAASISPHAESFYRPFDRGAVTARALVTSGLRGGGRDLMLLVGLSVALGFLGLLPAIVTGAMFDLVIPGGHRALLLQLGVWLVAGALTAALLQLTREIIVLRLVARFQATTEPALLGRLLDLPVPFFRKYSAGDLADRLLAVSKVREALTGPALSAVLSTLACGISFVLLLVYDVRLGLVATGLVLVLVGVVTATSYLQVRCQQRLAERTGRLTSTVLQLLVGVAKLRAAGAECRAFARWADQFAEQRRVAYQARRVADGVTVFMAAYPLVAYMVLFAVVALSHESGLSVGAFLTFNATFSQLIVSVMGLLQATTAICQVVPAYERARPILQAPAEVDTARADPGALDGRIEVKQVSFRYSVDGPPILQNVSIECRPGELVALVGPSGSGKSTLLRLLLGFEQPDAGAILYDGRDLAALDARAVRRHIGTVLQGVRLMSGDIFTNIVGGSTLTMDDAWEAARLAGLDDDIRQLPMQMHTIISEGSATLSGGQRQRLMIARAIAHRPRIVFLDEATSALDNRTQEIVARSLDDLAATRLVIAHRLSTIVHADRVYVLDHGRVVETGTYRDLMERGGRFTALARRQLL